MLQFPFSIIGVSETWLTPTNIAQCELDNYKLITCNRINRQGGGVALYIRNNIDFVELTDLGINDDNICQSLFIEFLISNHKVVYYVTDIIYRPPNADVIFFNDYLDKTFNYLNKSNKLISYLMGDFNINLLNMEENSITRDFFEIMTSYSYLPTIFRPTRVTSYTATLIDNCFTNNYEHSADSGILITDISDHLPIFHISDLKARNHIPVPQNKYSISRQIDKENIDKFKVNLGSVNWQTVYESTDSNISYNIFLNEFNDLYDKTFPLKKRKIRKTRARKPWISTALIKSITVKNKLNIKFLKERNSTIELKFKSYRNKLNHLLKIAKKRHFAMKLEPAKCDLKHTWRILIYPESFHLNNTEITDPQIISNMFNKYFANIGANLAKVIPNTSVNFTHYLKGSYMHSFTLYETNENEITKLILELNPNKSCGIDMIDPFIIKQLAEPLAPILSNVFNKSMNTGRVPDKLKEAMITPVYKSDDHKSFGNYRPISILPIFSKILERIIYNRLLTYLDKMHILSSNQYGFRKNYSTYMALIELIDSLSHSIDNNEYTIGIFVDLSEAFDTVDHKILISKLNHYGIRGTPLMWFEDYLSDRKQTVKFRETISSKITVTCGVPQGSILGPLLFLLYINDIANCSNLLNFILFGDDTSIYHSDRDSATLIRKTNCELDKLSDWFKANKLSLNLKKTNYIIFRARNKPIPSRDNLNVLIDSIKMKRLATTKFLGTYINEHLDWKPHISHVALKMAKSIGIINKVKHFITSPTRRILYCSLVLPYIQYCNIVWAKTYPTNLDKIMKLQKRAVRIIANAPYREPTDPLF